MLKRFFALITLGFFITFKCLTWVPAAAVSGIPSIDALEYAILQTIGMATANGAEIDFTNSLADIIHDVNEDIYSVEYGLKQLLKRYAEAAWDQIIFDLNDPNNQENLNFLANGIAAASGMSINSLIDISRQYQNKCLDTSIDVVAPFTEKVIAQWNKYRTDYINEYLNKINSSDQELPIPNPDPLYQDLLDDLAEYPYTQNTWESDFQNYSIVSVTSSFDSSTGLLWFPSLKPFRGTGSNPYSYSVFTQPITVNITSSENNYTVSYYGASSPVILTNNIGDGRAYVSLANSTGYNTPFSVSLSGSWYPTTRPFPELGLTVQSDTLGSYSTLEEAVDKVTYYFRNVNLFVDGQCWALSTGYNISSGLTVNVPNAVVDESSEDGKIASNPIYWVVDSDTGNPIDSQINLDKLANILKGMIDGTRSDTTVGFDDLVDAGAIEKTDGTVITDTDVGTRSVADVIADATTQIGDLSITGEIAGIIPPLPILPTFTAGPQGDPLAGFRGMSVLARIINVTNRGLPDDLIAMFYGIVAALIVLGLIKVLHK